MLCVKEIGHSAEAPAEVLGCPFAFISEKPLAGHGLHTTPQERSLVLVVSLNVAVLSATRFQYPQTAAPAPSLGLLFLWLHLICCEPCVSLSVGLSSAGKGDEAPAPINETAKPAATGDAIAAAAAVTNKAAGLL